MYYWTKLERFMWRATNACHRRFLQYQGRSPDEDIRTFAPR